MARFLVLIALCLLPVLANANPLKLKNPYILKGGVYCDTCRVGYETYASKKLAGAQVECVCRKRNAEDIDNVTYRQIASTDSNGEFTMFVYQDFGDDICDVILLQSPDKFCGTPDAGRDRARVTLTGNNGMATPFRFANRMGFLQDTPLAACPKILQQYQEVDTSV